MGANIWRNSHNPYRRELYRLVDRLGMVMWDEHRDYGVFGPSGEDAPFGVDGFSYLPGMHAMVKRDRNRPAIVMAGYCNEYACGSGEPTTGLSFRNVSQALAPHLLTAANGNTDGLDVQGHSHSGNSTFESFHKDNPTVPQVLSECCSCTSQRLPAAGRSLPDCIQDQNSPGLLPYVLGSLGVWTSFDYYGESHDWPQVSSPYGQFDIAGMPKPHAYWYRANWLLKRPTSDPGRPQQPQQAMARVLDLPDQLAVGKGDNATVRGVATSPLAELFADGQSMGRLPTASSQFPDQVQLLQWDVPVTPQPQQCEFPANLTGVQCHGLGKISSASSAGECKAACCAQAGCTVWQWADGGPGCWVGAVDQSQCDPNPKNFWVGGGRAQAPGISVGNLTVLGLSADGGQVQARHVVLGPREGEKPVLRAVVDVPSPQSGTGSRLLLDGEDTALLRAVLADSTGSLRSTAAANVSAVVVSGPGRVLGVGSGDPACKCQPGSGHCATYGGLARVLVQVTADCTSEGRGRAVGVDVDGGRRTVVAGEGTGVPCPAGEPIVVRVTAELEPSTVPAGSPATLQVDVQVETSVAAGTDGVLAVARESGLQGATDDVGRMMEGFEG